MAVAFATPAQAATTLTTEAKIAQLLIQKIEYGEIVEIETLDDTKRGSGAFGSTGK